MKKDKTLHKRIDRITRMEAAMDRVAAALHEWQAVQDDLEQLKTYYITDWRGDFEADEQGLFPADLKRGVLSEDGLFNLLEETDELLRKKHE